MVRSTNTTARVIASQYSEADLQSDVWFLQTLDSEDANPSFLPHPRREGERCDAMEASP